MGWLFGNRVMEEYARMYFLKDLFINNVFRQFMKILSSSYILYLIKGNCLSLIYK